MKPPLSKQTVLADVGTLVQSGELTLKELEDVYRFNLPEGKKPETPSGDLGGAGITGQHQPPAKPGTTLATALYVVGTVIVCIGIYLLIGQNWELMNTFSRVGVTVGLGLLLFAAAVYRTRRGHDANDDLLTACLFTIAATNITIGAGVVSHEAHANINAPGTVTLLALIVSALFTAFYFTVVRSLMVLLYAIGLAITAYYAGIQWAGQGADHSLLFYTAESMIAGTLIVAGGVVMRSRALVARLSNLHYEVGTLLFMGAAFWLTVFSGFDTGDSTSSAKGIYDLLYPLALAAGVALSVYVKSRSVLVITALFLTCYIFEISFEYFSHVLGGSVALVLAGVLVMGMAYGATRFAKRYIAKH